MINFYIMDFLIFLLSVGLIFVFVIIMYKLASSCISDCQSEKTNEIISGQKFYRSIPKIPAYGYNVGVSWNVKNISNDPSIIRKVYEHLSSAKKVYYEFFEVEDWDYFDSYRFYSEKLNSWCDFIHRGGNFSEFKVYKAGRRYDINYLSNLHSCPEFVEYLLPLYTKHKEEYLKDNNL